jgi:hypothetical protein
VYFVQKYSLETRIFGDDRHIASKWQQSHRFSKLRWVGAGLNAAAFSAAACEIRMTPDLRISADFMHFPPDFSTLFVHLSCERMAQ